MGERGPLPSPNPRRRNKRNTATKHIPVARPTKPRDLSPVASDEWNRVVPLLEEMGVLTALDRSLLVRYCTAYADWSELRDLMSRSSKLVRGQHGELVRNPLWIMYKDSESILADLSRQLNLTPVARLRSGIVHDKPPADEPETPRITPIDEYRKMLGAQ